MTGASTAIVYEAEPEQLTLPDGRPRTPALAGAPVESFHVLHRDAGGRSGIWECTPGRFESARDGDTELMHFVRGAGTITSADGTVHEIGPGVVLVAPDGWRGTWDIRETVRKIYTIWNSSPFTTGETA
jgi:uncharacterized cupin superfamily protein